MNIRKYSRDTIEALAMDGIITDPEKRNFNILKDWDEHKLTQGQLAIKYQISDRQVRKIIAASRK